MIKLISDWLKKIGLMKKNYKGQLVPVGAGIIFVLGGVLSWSYLKIIKIGNQVIVDRLIFVTLIIGAVGFIDDLVGNKEVQGFKGHFTQLMSGKLTSGALKALISAVTVLLVVFKFDFHYRSLLTMVINFGLILFMTNFLNLLDLRPGRAIKFFVLMSFVLLFLLPDFIIYFFPIFILLAGYTYFDLKGKTMLGDTGANALGIILGFSYSQWNLFWGKFLLFLVLLILTLLSERYSFTKFIANNTILNRLDQLGRDD